MNTVENVNPKVLLRRYCANREKFRQELAQYRKAVSDLHFNEVLIKSLKRSLDEYPKDTEYPKESDMARQIIREIQILKEKRVDLNSIVKNRKQNTQAIRIRANKYADLFREVGDINRLGKGSTTITVTSENDRIYVTGIRIFETGERKAFQFER